MNIQEAVRQSLAVGLLLTCGASNCLYAQHHYVFFNRDREKISDPAFLSTSALEGAQVKYVWRELEPAKDRYNFDSIRKDLAALRTNRKKLFVQLQDVSFDDAIINVPQYLRIDSQYNGGVARQYSSEGGGLVPGGWVARRWDAAVRERFHKLLSALGAEFDGEIAGINLAETAIGIEENSMPPSGFTFEAYRDAIISNMEALKRSFPKSVTMQYANFMPGEWLPDTDRSYLRGIYQAAHRLKVGVGGPDLLPHRRGQLDHAYPLIRASAGLVATGIAVQTGNYEHKHPRTGARLTPRDLHQFARDHLRTDYIFWGTQEPYFSNELLPYLKQLEKR